jgi:hypothetical protein
MDSQLYEKRAEEFEALAARAPTADVRVSFLLVAAGWRDLARRAIDLPEPASFTADDSAD